jgi:monoamine oxidase
VALTFDQASRTARSPNDHWAGTETATYWNGYMDGAVSSGERVAVEVINA